MRHTLLWALAAGIAALVLVPGSSTAEPTGLALAGGAPLRLTGGLTAESAHAWVRSESGDGLALPTGALEILSTQVLSSYQLLPTGDLLLVERRATTDRLLADAREVAARPTQGFWVAYDATDVTLMADGATAPVSRAWQDAHTQISVLLQPFSLGPQAASPLPVAIGESTSAVALAAGLADLRTQEATTRLTAERILLSGADVTVGDKSWSAATQTVEAPGSVYLAGAWTGPGTHLEETVTMVEIRPLEPHALTVTGPAHLYTSDLLLSIDGTAAFPWAEGRLDSDETEEWVSGDQLVASGTLSLRLLGVSIDGAPALHWLGGGQLADLQLGPAPPTVSTAQAGTIAAAATVTALAVAAAAWYWPLLKWAATGLLAPLYARVPREKVHDHGARDLVYERIKREPGVSTHRLAAEVEFGWSTLAYHLRVLERNQLIVSVRDGRYRRYFDRESGLYANGRKYVVAALRNDTTLALARAVLAEPGLTQKDLSERFQLSPSSVHWHVERLADVGLVDKKRDGHHVRHWPGTAWDQIQDADLGALPTPTLAPPANLGMSLAPPAPDA